MGGITDISWQAARGEPVRASQINGLVGAVRSLQPVESPTIRWERGPNGMAAHVRHMRAGGAEVVRQPWEAWTQKNATSGAWELYVMGGYRGVMNKDATELTGEQDDGSFKKTPSAGVIYMTYTLSQGVGADGTWSDIKQAGELPETTETQISKPIADVTYDSEEEQWTVKQRQYGDIVVFDLLALLGGEENSVLTIHENKLEMGWVRAHA